MEVSLPDIDPQRINDPYAKACVITLMNAYEQQGKQIGFLTQKIEEQAVLIAKLLGQAKKPVFNKRKPNGGNKNINVTTLLNALSKQKKKMRKKKKQIEIDQRIELENASTCYCGGNSFDVLRTETKVVQGISIKRNNVEYSRTTRKCRNCGSIHIPEFPSKGYSFDENIHTLVSSFGVKGRQSLEMLWEFFTQFGIDISLSEMDVMKRRNSQRLRKAVLWLKRVGISLATFLQTDATGSKRITKKGKVIHGYMQVIRTNFLSLFYITRKYNIPTMNKLLTKSGQKKPLTADDHSVNNGCRSKGLQLCLVHEVRLFKKLFPFFNKHQKLQQKILLQWRDFYQLAKAYAYDPPNSSTIQLKEKIINLFDIITSQITGYATLDKQLRLSLKKKDKLLYFLNNPYVPIHNNGSEQDLRQYVTIRKVLGPTRSKAGDESLARHLSVIQTIRKQGLPLFQTLQGLLTGTLSPAILTLKY